MQDYLKWACSEIFGDLIYHNMKVYAVIKNTCCGYECCNPSLGLAANARACKVTIQE